MTINYSLGDLPSPVWVSGFSKIDSRVSSKYRVVPGAETTKSSLEQPGCLLKWIKPWPQSKDLTQEASFGGDFSFPKRPAVNLLPMLGS